MKILMVIHGYPMRFNAGSEVYTQTITREFASRGYEIQVFTREENPFKPDYTINQEVDEYHGVDIPITLVNVARQKDRYQSDGVDDRFQEVLDQFQPEIVHFQHLNHLSLGIVDLATQFGATIFYTLHDYWLACPRGQFVQINYGEEEPLKPCDGQDDLKCAIHCYSRYHRGTPDKKMDLQYWTKWVATRREIIERLCDQVDLFFAPSHHLKSRIQEDLSISDDKIVYLDYGFELSRFEGRSRQSEDQIVFGYIGTHTVQKGIQHLIEAFSKLSGQAKLRIWGREKEATSYLKELSKGINHGLDVEWLDEYQNEEIIEQVFNHLDVIVVPSIWDENSPLVIHEALQTKIPIITADHGGMAEYVEHQTNGLLYSFRDIDDLREKMQYVIDNPHVITKLGETGYLQSSTGDIISVQEHVDEIVRYYREMRN